MAPLCHPKGLISSIRAMSRRMAPLCRPRETIVLLTVVKVFNHWVIDFLGGGWIRRWTGSQMQSSRTCLMTLRSATTMRQVTDNGNSDEMGIASLIKADLFALKCSQEVEG